MNEKLLTSKELAERLGVVAGTVQMWAKRGRIPCVRLGKKVIRYRYQDVLTALERASKQHGPVHTMIEQRSGFRGR